MGVAVALAGSAACHSSPPVPTSKARIVRSRVAAMNTNPLAVTIGPPRVGVPQLPGSGKGADSGNDPSAVLQRIVPAFKSTAVSMPQGGGLHGAPKGENRISR